MIRAPAVRASGAPGAAMPEQPASAGPPRPRPAVPARLRARSARSRAPGARLAGKTPAHVVSDQFGIFRRHQILETAADELIDPAAHQAGELRIGVAD